MQMFLKSSPYRDYGEGYSYMKIIVKVNVTILNIPYVCTYKTWLITQFYVFFDQRRPTLCMYKYISVINTIHNDSCAILVLEIL